LLLCSFAVLTIYLGHQEDLAPIAIAQRRAHSEFTRAAVVLPRIVHEVDAIIVRGPNYAHRFSIGLWAPEMSNRGRGGGVCLMGPVHLARPRLKFKTLFHLYFLSAVRQEPDSNCNNTDNHQKSDRIT
jgi:hypothetical protein